MKTKKIITYKLIPHFTSIVHNCVVTVERVTEIEYVKTFSTAKQVLNALYGINCGTSTDNTEPYDYVTITKPTDQYRILVYDTCYESVIRKIDCSTYDDMYSIISDLRSYSN